MKLDDALGSGTPALLWLALGWGLAGGFSHCIGMCGVFVVSYTGQQDKNNSQRFVHPERHLLFHGGRLCSLLLLGMIAGMVGDLSHIWAAAQGAISIAAGILMVGLAVGFAGIVPRWKLPEPDILGAGGGRMRKIFLRILQSQRWWKPLMTGVFVGFLPCGLTYYALIPAAMTHSPLSGASVMLAFGLGTVPGLLTLGLFGNALFGGLLMNIRFRQRMTKIAAALMLVMGIAFLWRGLPQFLPR